MQSGDGRKTSAVGVLTNRDNHGIQLMFVHTHHSGVLAYSVQKGWERGEEKSRTDVQVKYWSYTPL